MTEERYEYGDGDGWWVGGGGGEGGGGGVCFLLINKPTKSGSNFNLTQKSATEQTRPDQTRPEFNIGFIFNIVKAE